MGSDEEDDGGSRKLKPFHTCEWTPDAVFCLMGKYGEKYAIGRGLLRNTDWEEVVHSVNSICHSQSQIKTVKQCKDKIDSLKKRYKTEKTKILGGGSSSSTWIFFNKMDEIMKSVPITIRATPKIVKLATLSSCGEDSVSTRSSPIRESDSEQGRSSQRKEKTTPLDNCSDLESSSSDDDDEDDEEEEEDEDEDIHRNDPIGGDCQKKIEQFSDTIRKILTKKRQACLHPVKALADAIVEFSDVYARIEIAKMEVYTDMQLEIAKLQSRKEKPKRRKTILSGFSGSEMI